MNSPTYKLRYKSIAYVFLLSLFLQSCSSVCNQLIPQKKPKLKQTITLLTRTRTGLVLEPSFQRALLSQLPPDYELGTAYGEGDCFFDALAQSLNKINRTDINTDKHLRMLCHKFYQGNKRLVANWDLKDSREKGVSKERYDQHEYYYSKIQYTADECDRLFNQDICIWGRPWVEGVMLCRKLQLKGICSIEVFKDPETGNPVISYHLVKQAGYQSSISEEDGWALINKGDIPVLVNVQNELHFVPLWEKNPFLKDQRSQINLEINQEVCLSKEIKNLKKAKLRNSKQQYGARQRRSQREYLNSFYEQINAKQPINCQGFDLCDIAFTKLDLRGADFSGANLKRANFRGANLQGAKFINAQLQKTNFCYADLTQADLRNANTNGAKFKSACLHNLKHADAHLTKGTLLADKQQLAKKLEEDKEIASIKREFITNTPGKLIVLASFLDLTAIHHLLYTRLAELVRNKEKYVILDFRQLFLCLGKSENVNPTYLFEECLSFLQALLFRPFVKEVVPICENSGMIVFLKIENEDNLVQRASKQTGLENLNKGKLDLHGKIPLDIKYQWIDKFIKTSYRSNAKMVEIITGRGLNNPKGKMGVLWHACKTYLVDDKFRPYIQQIQSTSKNGGWKVIFKKDSKDSKECKRERKRMQERAKKRSATLDLAKE